MAQSLQPRRASADSLGPRPTGWPGLRRISSPDGCYGADGSAANGGGGSSSSSRGGSIARAKQVLAEAVGSAAGGTILLDAPSIRDTGVLSPLLAMIRDGGACCGGEGGGGGSSGCSDAPGCATATACSEQKVLDALDTVCYLAVDNANRAALLELGALQLMLSRLQRGGASAAVTAAALRALPALARSDTSKRQVWAHPGSAALLELLQGGRQPALQATAFGVVRALLWPEAGPSGAPPLEPRVLGALTALMQPDGDTPVLLAGLRMLAAAAEGPASGELPVWQPVVFALAPLLQPGFADDVAAGCGPAAVACRAPGAVHDVRLAALDLLLLLGEVPGLQPAVVAAGCVPALLALLSDGDGSVALRACGVLTAVAECRPGVQLLSERSALLALLRTLAQRRRPGASATDTRLAMLRVLSSLARAEPAAAQVLHAAGAAPLLLRLSADDASGDVRAAAAAVLQELPSAPPIQAQGSSELLL